MALGKVPALRKVPLLSVPPEVRPELGGEVGEQPHRGCWRTEVCGHPALSLWGPVSWAQRPWRASQRSSQPLVCPQDYPPPH